MIPFAPTENGMWYGISCIAYSAIILVPYQGHTI